MEKSWNMKYSPKVMEFCYQSVNFTNFAPTKKVSIDVERGFPQNAASAKSISDGHGKVMEKYFVDLCSGNPVGRVLSR